MKEMFHTFSASGPILVTKLKYPPENFLIQEQHIRLTEIMSHCDFITILT